MISRRQLMGTTAMVAAGGLNALAEEKQTKNRPVVISTWRHGLAANKAAWKILSNGGRALDAVEAGVRESESDPKVSSVGFGGLPDASGQVTLDACIMDENGDCGSVAYLKDIENPISVARLELMRQGNSPQDACRLATERVIKKNPNWKEFQVGFIAIDKLGRVGGYCIQPGFDYAVYDKESGNRMVMAPSRIPAK